MFLPQSSRILISNDDLHFVRRGDCLMFCPSCGSQNSIDQKFCRSCGMNLEQSVSSILEQYPDGSRAELQRQERSLEKFGSVAFGGFGIVVGLAICGFIYLIFMRMILSGTSPVAGVLLILFLIFAALTLAYVIQNETLKEKRRKIEPAPGAATLAPNASAKLLDESRIEPVPSVTENTTRRLKVERKNAK